MQISSEHVYPIFLTVTNTYRFEELLISSIESLREQRERDSFDLFDCQEWQSYVLIDTAEARSSDYLMAQHRGVMLKVTIVQVLP